MNRQETMRGLRRSVRVWQAVSVCSIALLLLGAGGLTMSSLRVTASGTGEHVRMTVGSDEVFVIDGTDKDARVSRLRVGANGPLILSGTVTPDTAAPEGSLYLQTNGTLWVKTGADDTDWGEVNTGP
jgi:hypothetical protein